MGEFGTYGLLRALAGPADARHRLGVVWWLVADEPGNNDGGYTEYLAPKHEQRFRPCDPPLFDSLREIVSADRRNVAAIAESPTLPPGAVFYERLLSYEGLEPAQRLQARDGWCSDALDATEGCDLVFLDPDNGVARCVCALPLLHIQGHLGGWAGNAGP